MHKNHMMLYCSGQLMKTLSMWHSVDIVSGRSALIILYQTSQYAWAVLLINKKQQANIMIMPLSMLLINYKSI